MVTDMPRHAISQELAQKILDYLATRPYHEVFQLVAELREAPQIGEPVPEDPPAARPPE